jgi:hypothetical protein
MLLSICKKRLSMAGMSNSKHGAGRRWEIQNFFLLQNTFLNYYLAIILKITCVSTYCSGYMLNITLSSRNLLYSSNT